MQRQVGSGGDHDEKPESRFTSHQLAHEEHEEGRPSRSEHGWKPLSLTTLMLGALAVLTLLIVATIEVLAQRSQKFGGLAISPSLEEIPDYAMWSYLYGPNLVAVLYSMIWTWVDLDARRMQPWFELSKPQGATAENSLLLEYSFDFVAVVPWKSGKKKHWPVFLASTGLMLVFWAITPLQSAILATGVINRPVTSTLSSVSQLMSPAEQPDKLNSFLRGEIYFNTWLDLDYPAFTTPEYALMPFYLDERTGIPKENGNISAITTKFWTELSCSAVQTNVGDDLSPSGVQWDNSVPVTIIGENGCNATVYPDLLMSDEDPEFSMDYWGSFRDDDEIDSDIIVKPRWELASAECPDVQNQFVAGWMHQKLTAFLGRPKINITATWCHIHYYKQRVRAFVDAQTLRPLPNGVLELGQRELLSDKEFNTTAFEKFLKRGQLDGGLLDLSEELTYQHDLWLYNSTLQQLIGTERPVKDPVGYALAVDMRDLQDYADPDTMAQAFDQAWKQRFAMSIRRLTANSSSMADQQTVIRGPMTAIVVSRSFATAVECMLLVVVCITLALLWACRRSHSSLRANPSSIQRIGDIARHSPDLINLLDPMDTLTEDELLERMRGMQFRLAKSSLADPAIEIIGGISSEISVGEKQSARHFEPKRPWALHRGVGVGFLFATLGVVIGLGYLKAQEQSGNGLARPSNDFEILQLLENYIPTFIATLTEPFWLMLNRLLCLLQPFKDLCKGKAKPKRSTKATYTAIPPQLVVWRAFVAKHLVLAVVCMTALLANLLALSMGALFNEEPVIALRAGKFATTFSAHIDKSIPDFILASNGTSAMLDHRQPYDVAVQANITHSLPLPPWTTSEYFFQPLDLSGIPENGTVTVRTRGFTIDTNCEFFAPETITSRDMDDKPIKGENINETLCEPPSTKVVDVAMRGDLGSSLNPDGLSKYEYRGSWPLQSEEPGTKIQCDPTFIMGWGRATRPQDNTSDTIISKIQCRPKFQTGMFNITIDKAGTVLNHTRPSGLEPQLPNSESQDNIRMIIATLQVNVMSSKRDWTDDPLPSSAFNWLLSTMRGSDSLVDPKKELPDAEKDIVPFVEQLFRKYFVSFLAFNTALFADTTEGETVDGALHVKEARIFMNKPAFIISQVVLGIYIMAAVLFYAQTSMLVLPRMPTTIGSIIAYIAPSRLVTDCGEGDEAINGETFSFGRYVGHDGKTHVGIERDPYVARIDPESLGKKIPWLRRLGASKREQAKELQPWL